MSLAPDLIDFLDKYQRKQSKPIRFSEFPHPSRDDNPASFCDPTGPIKQKTLNAPNF